MSVSETLMTSRDHFTVAGVQNSPANVPATTPVAQNMHLGYSGDSTAVFPPISTSPPPYPPAEVSAGAGAVVLQNLNSNSSEQMKRKRGRPRKYGPDGSMALGVNSPSVAAAGSLSPQEPVTSSAAQALSAGPASPTSSKKARGRPPGSSKKQQMDNSFGSTGFGFTPHIITVKTGEDVASKIMSFSQNGPRAVCILSASGAISNVTLRQAATSGGTATYEGPLRGKRSQPGVSPFQGSNSRPLVKGGGSHPSTTALGRFDILSLSGSFLLSEIGGQRSRTGGLSLSLAGSDGRIFGGCVAGVLTAASPVQVIVGSFISDARKESKSANHFEASPAPVNANPGGMMGASSSPSRGTLSESSGGPGSPLNQSAPVCTNSNLQGMSSMPWK